MEIFTTGLKEGEITNIRVTLWNNFIPYHYVTIDKKQYIVDKRTFNLFTHINRDVDRLGRLSIFSSRLGLSVTRDVYNKPDFKIMKFGRALYNKVKGNNHDIINLAIKSRSDFYVDSSFNLPMDDFIFPYEEINKFQDTAKEMTKVGSTMGEMVEIGLNVFGDECFNNDDCQQILNSLKLDLL